MTTPPTTGEIPLEGLAERLAAEDLPLGVFCDEELAAVGQPVHPEGPMGWFAELDEEGQLIATQAGLRGLISRGMLRPGEGAGELLAHPALELLRTGRTHAWSMTQVYRSLRHQATERSLIHLVSPGVMLEEIIDLDGLHAFTMRSPQRAAQALATRCDPEQFAGSGQGDAVGGEHPDPAVLKRIDALFATAVWSTTLTTVQRTADGSEPILAQLSVLAGEDGLWGVTTRQANEEVSPVALAAPLLAQELPVVILALLDPTHSPPREDSGPDAGEPTS